MSLDDEAAIQVEILRLGAMLREIDSVGLASPTTSGKGASKPAAGPPQAEHLGANEPAWRARIELDRARLSFYSLDAKKRDELLRAQAAKRDIARVAETEEQRLAREAAAEREQALAAARAARSEAERLVGEELARTIGLQQAVVARRADYRKQRAELAARGDVVLGWQRRVRDAKTGPPVEADDTYDALRRHLRGARDALSAALDQIDARDPKLPSLGADALANLPSDVPTVQVRERRQQAAKEIREAEAHLATLRSDRAEELLSEVSTLNRERLGLLAHLSAGKRDAITGLTMAALDQARSELRHLLLILRYHRHVAGNWLRSVRGGEGTGFSSWRVAALVVPWLLVMSAFVWWRRWLHPLLGAAEQRLAASERRERQLVPGTPRKVLRFFAAVHGPLEWLLLLGATLWLLPATAFALLEVQLLASIVGWSLASGLFVHVVNALVAGSSATLSSERSGTGQLRLRSLQMVGRVVLVLAVVLAISARLVGEGTLYSWVWSLCWLLVVPVLLILVRWWRPSIFERVDRARKKSPLQAWVLRNRVGWKSLIAAVLGAAHLLTVGGTKTVKSWLSGFDLARRAHAYLFKRELDRLAGESAHLEVSPLRPEVLAALAPDRLPDAWIAGSADDSCAPLQKRALAGRGGVIAIVGPRGQGKSSLLRHLAQGVPGAQLLSCIAHPSAVEIGQLSSADADASAQLVLLDDAQALIKPAIGGLRVFDDMLALARTRSERTLWVFAIDSVLWPFLARARDGRPLFDDVILLEPWSEEQLGGLLLQRSKQAGIMPIFDDLLDKLPPGADEIDRQDALRNKRDGYVRMLWDHARGNPGMALEVWRASLVEDDAGAARVRPLQLPNSGVLERLPDSALFILRAVLQLAPASSTDVMEATRVSHDQVLNAFRFGVANGYLSVSEGKAQVTWRWLRPVVRLLERRHLLVNS